MLDRLMGSPNIASKEYVYHQYDHMVRTNTVLLPGGDGAVLRIKGTNMGLSMTLDGNSRYCYLDPYTGGLGAVAEACRNLACTGAEPLAATNCLNFGNPEKPEIMWQFARAVEGINAGCLAFDTPITGGNVSFYNETLGQGIYPTPVLGLVGVLPDIRIEISPHFKQKDDMILLLGENLDELGGSEYQYVIQEALSGPPPAVDVAREKALQGLCLELVRGGLVRSAHDCAEGGLAVTLAEKCFAPASQKGWGANITLKDSVPLPSLLFGESHGRVIVSCPPGHIGRVEKAAERFGVPCAVLGTVGGDRLTIQCEDKELIDMEVSALEETWKSAIGKYFNS
jgi:phosphoribosylformylglycinamidine synthase